MQDRPAYHFPFLSPARGCPRKEQSCVSVFVCMCVCVCVCVCVCLCMHACMPVYMHVCLETCFGCKSESWMFTTAAIDWSFWSGYLDCDAALGICVVIFFSVWYGKYAVRQFQFCALLLCLGCMCKKKITKQKICSNKSLSLSTSKPLTKAYGLLVMQKSFFEKSCANTMTVIIAACCQIAPGIRYKSMISLSCQKSCSHWMQNLWCMWDSVRYTHKLHDGPCSKAFIILWKADVVVNNFAHCL